jgi:superoxide dismutase
MNKRIRTKHQHHEDALRHKIEEEVQIKYLKRINYLVGANNELMRELQQIESESVGHIAIPNVVADNIVLEENF